jgi:hypothetical protein
MSVTVCHTRRNQNEPFELTVNYKGEKLLFASQLKQFGNTHRFVADVYGQEIFIELDEELLKAVAEAMEAIIK